MYHAYFLDAKAAQLTRVEIKRSLECEEICKLIGCQQTEAILLDDTHVVLFDEDGLGAGLQCVAEIEGVAQPLGGNLIIAGVEGGNLAAPILPLHDVVDRIDIVRPLLDPTSRSGPGLAARQLDFSIRLVRHKPNLATQKLSA